MKKLFVILFIATLAGQVWAQSYFLVDDNLEYTIIDEENHYVSVGRIPDEDKPEGELVIPSKVHDVYTVISIGNSAFSGCSNLTSVTIPNSVTEIGIGAFSDCNGLTSVTFGNSVTNIGGRAFDGCGGLTSVNIPNSVTNIGDYAFRNCYNLTTLIIGNSVTNIGDYAFRGCSELTSVTIPNSVTNIGANAFSYCSGLTSVSIGNSVTNIGDWAFLFCHSLTSVTIPNSVTNIGGCAFHLCNSLTSLIIGNSVTSIGNNAFSCTGLTTVTIPKSVINIGEGAFENCHNLNYNQYDNALYLGNNENPYLWLIRAKSTDITSCEINNDCMFIYSGAFSGCCSLTSVTIGNSVTNIGNEAFYGPSSLKEIVIPESVHRIGSIAFCGVSIVNYMLCKAKVPPTLDGDVFPSIDVVHVPADYVNDYKSAPIWKWKEIVPYYTLEAESNSTSGTVVATDSILFDDKSATVTAIPSEGYHFTRWSNGSTENPYSVTLTENLKLTAFFDEHSVVIADSVPATCTETGLTKGRYCEICGEVLVAQKVVPAKGHTEITDGAVAPTCFATGLTEGKHCSECNVKLVEQQIIPMIEHTIVKDDSLPPTCEATGLTEGSHCSVCNAVIIAQKEVDALGHDYGVPEYEWSEDGKSCVAKVVCQRDASHVVTENASITSEETIAATCEDMGTTTYTATFRNSLFTTQTKDVVDIAALEHIWGAPEYIWSNNGKSCEVKVVCQRDASHIITENATITKEITIAASCENKGTTTYTATFENALFSVQTKAVEDIPMHFYGEPEYVWSDDGKSCVAKVVCQHDANHIESENASITSTITIAATCEGKGTTTYTATFENAMFTTQTKSVENIPANGHAMVTDAAVSPTCTATGLTEGSHCTTCNKKFVEQQIVPMIEHTVVVDEAVAATCTKTGKTEGKHCSVCNTVIVAQTKIPAMGHTVVIDEAVATTCTESGKTRGKHCSVCGEILEAQEVLAAKGHIGKTDAAVTPTCTKSGLTEGKHCIVCNAVLVEQEVVPAKGHTVIVDAAVAPTCTKAGKTEGKHCSVCKEVLVAQEIVPANGHTEVIDAAVMSTCTESGKTEGKHCSVCNKIIVAQTEIPALGHEFENYVYNNDATTEADGTETAKCEHGCGETDTRTAVGTKLATGISESAADNLQVYAHHSTIIVENATEEIRVYNAMGALVGRDTIHRVRAELQVNGAGVYIVKVGTVAKRVMIND